MSEVFEHDGLALAYEQAGDVGAPPVVLLHGLSSSRATWVDVIPALAADRHVLVLDQRGHGESARAGGDYRVEHYTADAAAFIEQVAGGSAAVVGHSLGGLVTAHLMSTRPELLQCALLEDPPLFMADRATFEQTIFAVFFPLAQQTLREMRDRGAPLSEYEGLVHAIPAIDGSGSMADALGPEGTARQALTWSQFDPEAFTPAIDGSLFDAYRVDVDAPVEVPVRLLRAERELGAAFFPEHTEPFLARHARASVELVAGASHLIHDEQPERFITEVTTFLDAYPPPPRA